MFFDLTKATVYHRPFNKHPQKHKFLSWGYG